MNEDKYLINAARRMMHDEESRMTDAHTAVDLQKLRDLSSSGSLHVGRDGEQTLPSSALEMSERPLSGPEVIHEADAHRTEHRFLR